MATMVGVVKPGMNLHVFIQIWTHSYKNQQFHPSYVSRDYIHGKQLYIWSIFRNYYVALFFPLEKRMVSNLLHFFIRLTQIQIWTLNWGSKFNPRPLGTLDFGVPFVQAANVNPPLQCGRRKTK